MSETGHTPPLRRGERVFHPMVPKALQESPIDGFRSGADTSHELHGTSRVFVSKYNSRCPRCNRWIEIGSDVHYHNDYPNVVHVGCHDPLDDEPKSFVIKGKRNPVLCGDCNMEHVGECM